MSETLYDRLSTKRKKLQSEGLVPEWYTTAALQMFEEKYEYQTNGRSVKGQFERIAKTAAKHIEKEFPEAENNFFNLLWNGWLSPSTPVLANMGTDRGMPVSCSGGVIGDSIDSFYKSQHELAMLTKYGFGTSSDLSNIRPRGSKISVGGKASGVLPVYKMYVETMRNVAQGTSRRGAWAGYLDIEHGDFDELWNAVNDDPDDSNIGWIIRNSFIEKLNSGDTEAVRRYQKALKLKMVQGKGYFCFVDKINAKRPAAYVNNNLTVKASNLCDEITLHSDEDHVFTCQPNFATVISKEKGLCTFNDITIGDSIWSETGWTKVVNKISSGIKPTYKYLSHNGIFIGTEDHRVVENGKKIEIKNASTIDGISYTLDKEITIIPEIVLEGLLVGDGTVRNKKVALCIGEKDQDYYNSEISHLIEHTGYSFFRNSLIDFPLNGNTYERDIDLSRYSTNSKKASFLRGLFTANGSCVEVTRGKNIVLTASSEKVAVKAMYLLQSLGLSPRIYSSPEKNYKFNNGTYCSKKRFFVVLLKNSDVIYFNQHIGFIQKYKNEKSVVNYKIPKQRKNNAKIFDREYIGDFEVFHIEVDNSTHTYWTGGLNVSNCVLSSMNVYKYDEWKDTDAVFWATIFLDCVAEEFIQKGKDIPGLEKAIRSTIKGRALGLGQCGWHSLLQKKRYTFGGFDAQMLSMEIAQHIFNKSAEASTILAFIFGEPEWCKGTGLRNTHRIAIAPTKSTALLMGGISEGINPDPGMVYTQNTAAGVVDRIVPEFLLLLKEKGHYSRKTLDSIISKQGSVQHLEWLTDEEKAVFKTAFEINQKDIIRQAATRGKYLDQWQSLNLFFPADEDEAWISEVHQEAFENKDILGLYYIYTQAGVTGAKGECEACQ